MAAMSQRNLSVPLHKFVPDHKELGTINGMHYEWVLAAMINSNQTSSSLLPDLSMQSPKDIALGFKQPHNKFKSDRRYFSFHNLFRSLQKPRVSMHLQGKTWRPIFQET